jgi:hypothetical protein
MINGRGRFSAIAASVRVAAKDAAASHGHPPRIWNSHIPIEHDHSRSLVGPVCPPYRMIGIHFDDRCFLIHHQDERAAERDNGEWFVSGIQHKCAHVHFLSNGRDGFAVIRCPDRRQKRGSG